MTRPASRRIVRSLLVVEAGAAVAVLLVGADRALAPVAGAVLAAALVLGLVHRRGRPLAAWAATGLAYRGRVRVRQAAAPPASDATDVPDADLPDAGLPAVGLPAVGGRAPDPTDLAALRLLVGDLRVAGRRDHDGRRVGLAGHDGVWAAVLVPDAAALAVLPDAPPPTFPLDRLGPALVDRGVVLEAVALWSARSDAAVLHPDAPAVAAHRELSGRQPVSAARRARLLVRLDPARCPDAVAARGGGPEGAQRALLGALARLRRASADTGLPLRPLDPAELVRAGVEAADLAHLGGSVRCTERWDAVVVAGREAEAGHATWVLTRAPETGIDAAALTVTSADTTTLAATLEPVPGREPTGPGGDGAVAVRVAVRLTARTPDALAAAGVELTAAAAAAGITVRRLDGAQVDGLAATLPLPERPRPRTRAGDALGAVVPVLGVGALPSGPPAAPVGVLLGADADGRPVEATLLRPVPTAVVLVGGSSPARELAARALVAGARLVVVTGRPDVWEPLHRAAGPATDRVLVTAELPADLRGVPAPDAPPLLVVHDRGALTQAPTVGRGPWRTTLLVLPALDPAAADVADPRGEADLVLLTRRPPHEAEAAGRWWRLGPARTEVLATLPDHALVALGDGFARRVDRVTGPRETALLGPVRTGD